MEDISIEGARGLLINISCAENNVTLDEVNEACSLIQKEAHPDATVIFGVAWDNSLEDNLRITVIATGIGQKEKPIPQEKPGPSTGSSTVTSLEEINRRGKNYDRPPGLRNEKRKMGNLSEFERPHYSKYENFVFEDEDLERPTFMRRKAD